MSPAVKVDFWQNFRNSLKAPIVVGRAFQPLALAIEASTGSKPSSAKVRAGTQFGDRQRLALEKT